MNIQMRAILLASVSALAANAAAAQEVIDLEAIRVEADAAQDALGNVEISSEEIAERNAASTDELFAGQSEIIASGGAVIAQKVLVHGLEESNLAVTIDGARQNKGAFHHTGNVPLDPFLLKRVQVSSGLAPADAGPGALAGIIAYETKDARDLLEPGATVGGFTGLTFGSNGGTFRRSAAIYGMQGGFDYLVGYSRQTGDDYEDGAGTTIGGTEPDMTDYFAKVGYTTDSGKRFVFSAEHVSDQGLRAFQGGITRPDFTEVPGRATTYDVAVTERTSYSFTYTDENPQGIWAPTIQLAWNEQYVDAGAVAGRNTSLSGKVENAFSMGNGVLTAGLDFFSDEAEALESDAYYLPNGKERIDSIGVYAQMRQDVSARVSLSYGIRFDSQTFKGADGQEFSDSGISVNGSADVILSNSLTLNVGVASVWGGYELNEAALIGRSDLTGNTAYNWDNYGPQTTSRANNARIGLRYEQGPWQAGFALFHTELEGVDNAFYPNDYTGDLASYNVTSRGFDAKLRYTGARGYIEGNWTYADVSVEDQPVGTTSYYIGRPVGHVIGLSGAYELNDQWMIGGTAEIALEQDEVPTGYAPLDSYEVLNLWTTWTPRAYENLTVRLDVKNVFDTTYTGRGNDGDGFSRVVPLTEPGRTILLSANMKF
ncbi:TonB-dependent receptor domain-containing protein [Oceanicola sp. 502str15]|uniref:TonB-dependent receptor domain-containing protein n=1 Tax=Oceanicola sp. 502str15 TaxID=2696061 RepID=UPI0020940BF4|nr:TonB-dependent receptor [Oceanicola sp. 502str15]MCO6384673.1 TonB-dependent receptor [Oceanicola sp. 502str15]